MAQLFFKYGAMNSGKSIDILKTAHNYTEQDKNILLFTSGIDDRDAVGSITSRIGISQEAQPLYPEDEVFSIVLTYLKSSKKNPDEIACILVDESQFLTRKQVIGFSLVVDELEIPVMCFGLKNDFQNKLFEGSESLLLYADKIEEIKTICWYCKKKAIMNLRFSNDLPVYEGEQIEIGGNESYVPVCRNHYHNPKI